MASSKKCRIAACRGKAKTRDVCDSCYRAARRAVIAGETTWEDLERAGVVSPVSTKTGMRLAIDRLAKRPAVNH
jgi:hypothetical protein